MGSQSYLGMPMPSTGTSPQELNQSQTAASTGTSSSPLQSNLPTSTPDSGSGRNLQSQQTQDYGGGNPYLTGLNYSSQPAAQPPAASPPPAQPASSLPTGGTLPQAQSFSQAAQTGGASNIFGNTTPPSLANIPNIRQNPNGQWSDGEGRLYNPQTGAVFYNPGPSGWNGPGAFTGGVPQYQPTPYVPRGTSEPSGGQMGTQPVQQPVMSQNAASAQQPPTTTWNSATPNDMNPPGNVVSGVQSYPLGSMPNMPPVTNPNNPMPGDAVNIPVNNQPSIGGGGTTPTVQNPQVNPTGTPNSYNPFQRNTYPPNTTNPINFSGNNGPRPYSTGQVPEGFAQQPTLSPQMTEGYYNWLYNQLGQGASPYGQQQTFLPGQGGSSMQGLTAPEDPLARQGREGLQGFTQYMGGMIDPARLDSLQSAYGPYSQVGQSFAQTGGYGFPGQQMGLQAQYGARGNSQDPYGLYTGAQSLQGSASGQGMPGLPGQYLNSAMQYGGMGLPAQTQAAFAQYGAGPGAGGSTLSSMAQTGNPTDVGPAWDAMRQAQQRNIDQGAAQIRERMGLSGNLGLTGSPGGSGENTAALGTPYGTALTDYYNQAILGQNANLTQASQQAQEAARSRQLGAAGTMSGQQLGAAQNLGGLQQQAGLFGAGQQTSNSQYLQNLMSQGANQLGANQLAGAGLGSNITNQSQQTPYNIYGNLLGMQQGNINNMASLGQQYQGLDQAAINRQYQEYLRTSPEYSPLLPNYAAAANTFPGVYNQQFGTGIGGMLGQIAGSAVGSGGVLSGSRPWWAGTP